MKKLLLNVMVSFPMLLLGIGPVLAGSELTSFTSAASVGPILQMTVSQNTDSELKFGNIIPSALGPTQAAPQIITIDVQSNSGTKYVVTQVANGALDNGRGDTIGLENLRFRTASGTTAGAAVPDLTPMTAGAAQTIFTSNDQGESGTIQAEYQLSVPSSQAPGDYSTFITFTVSST